MEEEQSLALRRVEIAYQPHRTSEEILALAYQWLIQGMASGQVAQRSVQDRPRPQGSRPPLISEVMR